MKIAYLLRTLLITLPGRTYAITGWRIYRVA
jgi:hypothetical protein